LVKKLITDIPNMTMVVSYTSRPQRDHETEGVQYKFVSPEVFRGMVLRNEFVEFTEYRGNSYGTLNRDLDEALAVGDAIIIADVNGLRFFQAYFDTRSIYLLSPGQTELRRRLEERGDDPALIEKRLAYLEDEMMIASETTVQFDPMTKEETFGMARAMIEADRCLVSLEKSQYGE
jgi:guanylate kinase